MIFKPDAVLLKLEALFSRINVQGSVATEDTTSGIFGFIVKRYILITLRSLEKNEMVLYK